MQLWTCLYQGVLPVSPGGSWEPDRLSRGGSELKEGEAWVPVQMVYIQVPGEIKDTVICAPWSGDGEIFYLTPFVHANSLQLCLTLYDPMGCSPSAPLSIGFLRQEYWSGLPCPPPGPPDSVLWKLALKASKGWEGSAIPLQV